MLADAEQECTEARARPLGVRKTDDRELLSLLHLIFCQLRVRLRDTDCSARFATVPSSPSSAGLLEKRVARSLDVLAEAERSRWRSQQVLQEVFAIAEAAPRKSQPSRCSRSNATNTMSDPLRVIATGALERGQA